MLSYSKHYQKPVQQQIERKHGSDEREMLSINSFNAATSARIENRFYNSLYEMKENN